MTSSPQPEPPGATRPRSSVAESFTCPRCERTSYHPLDVANRYCGYCHVYIDQWLAFRVRVEGDLVEEHWFDAIEPGEVGEVAERHGAITERAQGAGLTWALEIYDPGADRTVVISSSSATGKPIDLSDHGAFTRRVAQALGYT